MSTVTSELLVKGGQVLCGADVLSQPGRLDILVRDGVIVEIAPDIQPPVGAARFSTPPASWSSPE